jgi:hypothetical protein
MAGETLLFKIDAIVAGGVAVPIEDGSGSIVGAAGFENEIVPSASGDDYSRRKRIPRQLRTRIQFGPTANPDAFAEMVDIQITARDTSSGRRALMTRCTFASMGEIGGGPVDVVWNVLSPIQWL